MYYFISDVHLGFYPRERERERERILINFFEKIASDCQTLFIVGDLFDYWFEYKTVIPRDYIHTLSALLSLRKKNIEIEYLMGNHDFGHKDFFQNELGIQVYRNDIERELNGKRFFISHGDGKIKNDNAYLILKKILRHPLSNKLYRLIHPDWGIKLASSSSKGSRNYTEKKNFGEIDSLMEFAKSKIGDGFDYVIMGHRHRVAIEKINNGYYINLGDWFKNIHFGKFDGEFFHLTPISALIKM